MDFWYPWVCTFYKGMITMDDQACHIKKNLKYFETKKQMSQTVGTEKKDEKMRSGFHTSFFR